MGRAQLTQTTDHDKYHIDRAIPIIHQLFAIHLSFRTGFYPSKLSKGLERIYIYIIYTEFPVS